MCVFVYVYLCVFVSMRLVYMCVYVCVCVRMNEYTSCAHLNTCVCLRGCAYVCVWGGEGGGINVCMPVYVCIACRVVPLLRICELRIGRQSRPIRTISLNHSYCTAIRRFFVFVRPPVYLAPILYGSFQTDWTDLVPIIRIERGCRIRFTTSACKKFGCPCQSLGKSSQSDAISPVDNSYHLILPIAVPLPILI